MKNLMSNSSTNNQRGYSLIEILLAIGISSIIAYSIFTVMRVGHEQNYASDVKMAIQDNGREGLYKMTQEMRLAAPANMSIAEDGKSVEFKVPDAASPNDSDYKVDWASGHTIQYQLDEENKQLIRIEDGDEDNATVIANDVTDVTFEGDANPPSEVSVTVGLERDLANGREMSENVSVTLNAKLRNTDDSDDDEEDDDKSQSSDDDDKSQSSDDDDKSQSRDRKSTRLNSSH